MAKNRAILKCRACGAELTLGFQNCAHGWTQDVDTNTKGRELADFIKKHSICYKEHNELPCDKSENFMYYPFELTYDNMCKGVIASSQYKEAYIQGYEDAGKHYEEISSLKARIDSWKNDYIRLHDIYENSVSEIKRLQSIIDSQKQSHGWHVLELERENKLLKQELKKHE